MDQRLAKLIADYQGRVADAVAMLESAGVPRPSSNITWSLMDVPDQIALPDGFSYFKHGFGCAVHGPEWRVDFDFGTRGEIDGFDAHRLYFFANGRLDEYGFATAEEIEDAVRSAHQAGDVTFSGYALYFVSKQPKVGLEARGR